MRQKKTKDVSSLIQKANALMEINKYDEAEPLLLVAMKHSPMDPEAYYLLGEVFCKQERFIEAITILQKADGLMPEHPKILHMLGWAMFMGGDPDQGRTYMTRALDKDAEDIQLLCDLAVLEMNGKEYQKAKEYVVTAKTIAPMDEMVLEVGSMVEMMSGMYRTVIQKN
jgi:tetratricopeptide (TPR) repeat protein